MNQIGELQGRSCTVAGRSWSRGRPAGTAAPAATAWTVVAPGAPSTRERASETRALALIKGSHRERSQRGQGAPDVATPKPESHAPPGARKWVDAQQNRWRDPSGGPQGRHCLDTVWHGGQGRRPSEFLAISLLELGKNIRTMHSLLGHCYLNTTMIYAHVFKQGTLDRIGPRDHL